MEPMKSKKRKRARPTRLTMLEKQAVSCDYHVTIRQMEDSLESYMSSNSQHDSSMNAGQIRERPLPKS